MPFPFHAPAVAVTVASGILPGGKALTPFRTAQTAVHAILIVEPAARTPSLVR
jgi:hypothetical protein